ncbi:MAG TPA: GAF domain-containing SpoIIE family protein phosphatase [Gaiellaceae bacterium]|nr:GAF domain-containing SpoIIE family protein phosphatase [Gaiellaceae bacterium]
MTSLVDLDLGDARPGASSLAALVRAVTLAAGAESAAEALRALAEAARAVCGADLALVRALNAGGERLEAVAVAAPRTLAAELYGTALPAEELPDAAVDDLGRAPAAAQRVAERTGATQLLLVPARADHCTVSLELFRVGEPFGAEQRVAAELCAAQAALVLRAFDTGGGASSLVRPALELAGEALAVALQEEDAADEVVRLAAAVAGASAAVLWERREGVFTTAAVWGVDPAADLGAALEVAESALAAAGPVTAHAAGLPRECAVSTTLSLGRPPLGVLQLFHPAGEEPEAEQLTRLATFGVRAAHALRTGERARSLALELERTRALLEVIVQATAELSVSHTLETAVERVAELLGVDRVAVYLRGIHDGELEEAASRGLAGPHARVADRLLDVALGPSRERAVLEVAEVLHDARLAVVAPAARETGIESALAVPLVARGDVVGLLAAYPEGRPAAGEHETALLAALAGQLAVAVRNAQLHEQATRLGEEREAALAAERAAARQIRALYEVSRSFAQSLRLDETLEALARTAVEVLDLDAAVVRMPDERREQLVARAVHVKDAPFAAAVRTVLAQPVPFGQRNVQRLFLDRRSFRLGRGQPYLPALVPFLEKGWTAAIVPVALPTEVVASLGVYSFRPGEPLSQETVEAATALAAQAALAIDNARLYQQQKQFADTMQRSLLPRSRPVVEGLEVGEVYEPSARVDVGGDVYDFLALDDGRLAVVLGDVTGHGVDATADMAMAKFVFRSLAREHAEPADFLASANDVICSEIGPGKFISMSYVVVDGVNGTVSGASAGHPAPRVVLPDGSLRSLEAHGLVLGIDGGQSYTESRADLPSGTSLVLYTDGVIEARRNGELYGEHRLDALLVERRELPARALAAAVAEDAREFAGGDLSDDLAVVVIRRT